MTDNKKPRELTHESIQWVPKKAYAALAKENEELKIKNQQYLEKMDKFPLSEKQELELQILELETEITSLRRSLKFAVEALEKVDFNHEISSYLLIRQALATIKAKHGEL